MRPDGDFKIVYVDEGRLRLGKFEGPVVQEDPMLETSDEERTSLDLVLRQFKNKYVRLTIEVLELNEDDRSSNLPERRSVRDTLHPDRR